MRVTSVHHAPADGFTAYHLHDEVIDLNHCIGRCSAPALMRRSITSFVPMVWRFVSAYFWALRHCVLPISIQSTGGLYCPFSNCIIYPHLHLRKEKGIKERSIHGGGDRHRAGKGNDNGSRIRGASFGFLTTFLFRAHESRYLVIDRQRHYLVAHKRMGASDGQFPHLPRAYGSGRLEVGALVAHVWNLSPRTLLPYANKPKLLFPLLARRNFLVPSAICREILACMQGKSVSSESLLIRPGDQASRRVKLEGFPRGSRTS